MAQATPPSRASPPTSASTSAARSTSRSTPTPASYTIDIYRLGWYGGDGARKVATVTPSASLPQTPAAVPHRPATELYDCGNWAVSASWDGAATRSPASTSRADAHRRRGGASHIPFIVRDDSQHLRRALPDLGPDLAGLQHLRRGELLPGRRANGRAYKISYNRPFATRGGTRRATSFQQRVPDDPVPGAQRVRRQLHHRRRHRPARRPLTNHKVFLSVGHDEYWAGGSAPTSRPPATPASTWRSSAATRSTGGPAGSRAIDGTSTRRTARWSATRRPGRTRRSTRRRSGPAPGATPVRPPATGAGEPENALTGTLYMANHTDLADQGAGRARASSGSGATPALAIAGRRADRHARAAHGRLRVRRGRRQRPPAAGPDPPVHHHRARRRSTCTDFGNTVVTPAPPPTT